jgi:hypothetical protein
VITRRKDYGQSEYWVAAVSNGQELRRSQRLRVAPVHGVEELDESERRVYLRYRRIAYD